MRSWSGTRRWCTSTRWQMGASAASPPSSSPWSPAPASRIGGLFSFCKAFPVLVLFTVHRGMDYVRRICSSCILWLKFFSRYFRWMDYLSRISSFSLSFKYICGHLGVMVVLCLQDFELKTRAVCRCFVQDWLQHDHWRRGEGPDHSRHGGWMNLSEHFLCCSKENNLCLDFKCPLP